MPPPIFEAAPNFSEGRDGEKTERIVGSVRAVPGVRVLGVHSDPDHNRSVLTFAGEEDAVLEASVSLARACAPEIDMREHRGEYPVSGSPAGLPFVPLEGATMDAAVRLARRAGERIGGEVAFSVYLYEAAATGPHRRNLADVRRREQEGIRSRSKDLWEPDHGPEETSPRLGAVGARPFLVAFNAFLDTDDVEVARSEAREAREVRGRDGGAPGLKALGFLVAGKAQVSMNLTALEKVPMPVALEAVRAAAAKRGTSVESTELVGLVSLEALVQTARHCLGLRESGREHVLEAALWE